MARVLEGLDPERVFYYFEEISRIPHGSRHTREISNYLASFARKNGLPFTQDKADNVIIFKEAAPGHERAETIILQGHIDMVLEKRNDISADLEKMPIRLGRTSEYIYADGTTLGGDDGIAVAMMLAILEDNDMVHPPLECVFTADEEIGMLGASQLDLTQLKGRKMINIDSEEEGIFTCGCAGGAECILTLQTKIKEFVPGTVYHIEISGLTGGHSGQCIQFGRGNANIILGRVLNEIYENRSFRLIQAWGGAKGNAIPRDAQADILFKDEIDPSELSKVFNRISDQILNEYAVSDPSLSISLSDAVILEPSDDLPWEEIMDPAKTSYRKKDTKRIIRLLMTIPNGVEENDPYDNRLPRTSLNLGIFEAGKEKVQALTLVRSNINSQKMGLIRKLKCLADLLEAELDVQGDYPAWEFKADSPFRNLLTDVYQEVTAQKAVIFTTHAGLECGLFAAGLSGLDCISLGPDIKDIHTPNERLYIASVQRTWKFLKCALEKLAWLD